MSVFAICDCLDDSHLQLEQGSPRNETELFQKGAKKQTNKKSERSEIYFYNF